MITQIWLIANKDSSMKDGLFEDDYVVSKSLVSECLTVTD